MLHNQSRLASLAGLIYLEQNPQIKIVELDLSQSDAPQRIESLIHVGVGPTYLLADSQVVEAYGLRERFPFLAPLRVAANPGKRISFWLFQPMGAP